MNKVEQNQEMWHAAVYKLTANYSKVVKVGLDQQFIPVVRIAAGDTTRNYVEFNVNEWRLFLEKKDHILQWRTMTQEDIKFSNCEIQFGEYYGKKMFSIIQNERKVCMMEGTLRNLFQLASLIECKIWILQRNQFHLFYKDVLRRAVQKQGDVINNVKTIIEQCKPDDNILCLQEVVAYEPEQVTRDATCLTN